MNRLYALKRKLAPLVATPLHPQWMVARAGRTAKERIAAYAVGVVIDVGCGNRRSIGELPKCASYIGLDYPTTVALGYVGQPDVFADAQRLPFRDDAADTILLLDVLEHLPNPECAVAEAARVLRVGGALVVQVPFLYPLHDEPYDYCRWTIHGLRALFARHHLEIGAIDTQGGDIATAAALTAMALAKSVFTLVEAKRLTILLVPLLVLLIPAVNIVGWLLDRLVPESGFMPLCYQVIASKPEFGC